MEQYTCKKSGRIGRLKSEIQEGMVFPVLRNIMNECVLITSENEPNIIASAKQLRYFGSLSGTPTLGGF